MVAIDTTAQDTDTQSLSSDGAVIDAEFEGTPIPETYKDAPVGKYRTIGEAFKGYGEAQKLIGAKGVIIPGDNAKPEDIDKFYTSLGRPVKSDGYKLDPVENAHERIKGNADLDKNFKAMAHKHGLTQKQASAMYQDYIGGISQGLTDNDAKVKADTDKAGAALSQEWGTEYDTKISKVKGIIEKFGGSDAVAHFNESGYGRDPVVLKTLEKISKNFSEDAFIKGDNVVPTDVLNAQKQIKEIHEDKTHAFWVKGKGHDEAIVEMRRLQEIATPNERKPRE